jgi:hypothetical protein
VVRILALRTQERVGTHNNLRDDRSYFLYDFIFYFDRVTQANLQQNPSLAWVSASNNVKLFNF